MGTGQPGPLGPDRRPSLRGRSGRETANAGARHRRGRRDPGGPVHVRRGRRRCGPRWSVV